MEASSHSINEPPPTHGADETGWIKSWETSVQTDATFNGAGREKRLLFD